jgi:hypothetical protein
VILLVEAVDDVADALETLARALPWPPPPELAEIALRACSRLRLRLVLNAPT